VEQIERDQFARRTNLSNVDGSRSEAEKSSPRLVSNHFESVSRKTEFKSLAPDGKACKPETEGLLGRAKIVARRLIPVGKGTDRHWEQGEDPSLLNPNIHTFDPSGKFAVADSSERKEWAKIGVRQLMRATRLTQRTVYSILSGKGVRHQTMTMFRSGIDSLRA